MRGYDSQDLMVHLNREELLGKLKTNKDEHRTIFEEAIEGYKKKAIELLTENLDNIKAGRLVRVSVSLALPEDHTKDYERVILMLEMHQNDYIDLSQEQFAQYVMDDWGWQRDYLTSAAFYGSASAIEKRRFSSYV